jgi:glutaredoxin-like protein
MWKKLNGPHESITVQGEKMPTLLNENVQSQVRDAFEDLKHPVHILFFGTKEQCQYCADTLQLVEEVTGLSEHIKLSIFDIQEDAAIAQHYNVQLTPGLVIAGEDDDGPVDYGIRYAGIPSGHEFSSLIQDIILVSYRDSGLNEATRDFLADLSEPVFLQVFVTPTCPYCPRAVIIAHQMAMESPLVEAEMVEATEFPQLSSQYRIMGVPDTVINHGAAKVVGAVPEGRLVIEIKNALEES